MAKANRYSQIIEAIFLKSYKKGITEVPFTRDEIVTTGSLFVSLQGFVASKYNKENSRRIRMDYPASGKGFV
jgi:hypothetical protein